jgi:hypothetical protein
MLPDLVDWHKEGRMTVPSDQGGCGSCWAFTTAATLEGGYAIKKNSSAERFSVQYLMDCDNVNQGCGGGWMLDAYAYTQKNGIVRESDYHLAEIVKTRNISRMMISKKKIALPLKDLRRLLPRDLQVLPCTRILAALWATEVAL